MGDHRLALSIRAEFHGKVYEIKDAWWNWSGPDVDPRVVEFFRQMWADGCHRWAAEAAAAEAERNKPQVEARERAELARLKAKYEAPS